ncbi:MAG: hypothetical protein AB1505_16355 [Candidatus Latescibacterota bacterium]
MARWSILLLAGWSLGCGGQHDELTPYVHKLHGLSHYNQTLVAYGQYLGAEATAAQAQDIAQVLARYRGELVALGQPSDKHLRALHNEMLRILDEASRKLVEPTFPTFVPNAQKAIRYVEAEMTTVINNLARLWQSSGHPDPCPLVWPAAA